MNKLKYLSHYNEQTQAEVHKLISEEKLSNYILHKYPTAHNYKTDKALFTYTNELKTQYLKKFTLSKVIYDGKINVIHNALGTHKFISRVQGGKLKAKNEIRIAPIFKNTPESFLNMIVVHELAHFKVKAHDKAFYSLCEHMQSDYHQLEFDLRLYLTNIDLFGALY